MSNIGRLHFNNNKKKTYIPMLNDLKNVEEVWKRMRKC